MVTGSARAAACPLDLRPRSLSAYRPDVAEPRWSQIATPPRNPVTTPASRAGPDPLLHLLPSAYLQTNGSEISPASPAVAGLGRGMRGP